MAFFREIPDKKLSDWRKLLFYNAFRRQEIVVNRPRLFILVSRVRLPVGAPYKRLSETPPRRQSFVALLQCFARTRQFFVQNALFRGTSVPGDFPGDFQCISAHANPICVSEMASLKTVVPPGTGSSGRSKPSFFHRRLAISPDRHRLGQPTADTLVFDLQVKVGHDAGSDRPPQLSSRGGQDRRP